VDTILGIAYVEPDVSEAPEGATPLSAPVVAASVATVAAVAATPLSVPVVDNIPMLAAKGMGKQWSLGDIQTPQISEKTCPPKPLRRTVSFLPTVEVTLIPCRREYAEAQVHDDVWWRDLDYSAFKEALLGDFMAFLQAHKLVLPAGAVCDRKMALRLFIELESRV
jgi:hypothetical protein